LRKDLTRAWLFSLFVRSWRDKVTSAGPEVQPPAPTINGVAHEQRRDRQVREAIAPLLGPGDTVDHIGLVKVGSVSARRRIATTAVAAVLSGGHLIAVVQPRPMYFALTAEQLLFLDLKPVSGAPGALTVRVPRAAVSLAPLRKAVLGLGYKTVLTIEGAEQALALTFAPTVRADGPALAALLPVTT
jgi:hypothetical protein